VEVLVGIFSLSLSLRITFPSLFSELFPISNSSARPFVLFLPFGPLLYIEGSVVFVAVFFLKKFSDYSGSVL